MDTEWMSQAKCKDMDPDVFFPSDGVGVQVAQRVCLVCPVKLPCLEYALAHRVHEGVWGGTSERERRRLLRHGAIDDNGGGSRGANDATSVSLPDRDPEPAGRH